MAEEYVIIVYKLDTPAYREREDPRFKAVAYEGKTSKRVAYVYNDSEQKAVKKVASKLPWGSKITVQKGY
jgi:hypothetical protein